MTWTSSKLLSALTVTTIGLTSKAFLNSGLCSIQVNGLQTLKNALKSHKRNSGQGIITGSCYFQPQPAESLNYNKCLIISQRACKYSKCPLVIEHLLQPRWPGDVGRASGAILLEFLYNSLGPRRFWYHIHQSVSINPLHLSSKFIGVCARKCFFNLLFSRTNHWNIPREGNLSSCRRHCNTES